MGNEIKNELGNESEIISSDDMTLEETFGELDKVVGQLEDGEISLEDSFRVYEKGMRLLKLCNEKIDAVEKKVQVISESGELEEFEV
ncbi:MAG: exodeoxyribonuclease VII small subunit [Lachnospiraceae bacterium]|nr:exodeoxyribonuclease VII small subunit [Candidatus Merdinaster equi]